MAGAIEISAAHRFDLEMSRFRRRGALRLEIETFDDVEHLDQRRAAGTGRRHRHDLESTERASHRRPFVGPVGGEICLRDQSAVCRHVLRDPIRDPSRVEGVGSFCRDRAKRLAEIPEDEPIAGRPSRSTRLAVGRDG
jgi:hypothetical protein